MREACTVDKIIATTSYIDSLDYRSISLEDTTDLVDFINVAEGSAFSDVKITVKDKLTKLKKYGKMISASYEAIKFQKLDLSQSHFAESVKIWFIMRHTMHLQQLINQP